MITLVSICFFWSAIALLGGLLNDVPLVIAAFYSFDILVASLAMLILCKFRVFNL